MAGVKTMKIKAKRNKMFKTCSETVVRLIVLIIELGQASRIVNVCYGHSFSILTAKLIVYQKEVYSIWENSLRKAEKLRGNLNHLPLHHELELPRAHPI